MFGIGPTELLLVAIALLVVHLIRTRPAARFSLRDLFIATTVIAVVLGLVCYTVR